MGRFPFAVAVAAVLLLSGCMDQVGVSNSTNSFSYGGQATGKDKTETYTWRNTMGGAEVSWGGQVGKGSISVTIADADGQTVFQRSLSEGKQDGFSGNTAGGRAGDWTITLVFEDYTGQIGLSITASGGAGGNWMP